MSEVDLSEEFIAAVLDLIDVSALAKVQPRLRVVADTGNGMVGPIFAAGVCAAAGRPGRHVLDPDGSLPNHGLDPLQPENRAELERRVVAEGAAVGFAFDGDGDRFFAIDDRGEFIAGDYMTALMGRYLLKKKPGSKIVYDVRASWAVPELITADGGIPLMERVGHAFIKRRMAEEGALYGGEVTGHYYFQDFHYADSGIVPSLIILEMLATSGKKMSELLAPLEAKYFISGEINSTVADAQAKMQELAERFGDGEITHLDGFSASYPTWHFNVRPFQHRAVAAPEPGGADARGDGAASRRGAGDYPGITL